jgi:hypothetical protein
MYVNAVEAVAEYMIPEDENYSGFVPSTNAPKEVIEENCGRWIDEKGSLEVDNTLSEIVQRMLMVITKVAIEMCLMQRYNNQLKSLNKVTKNNLLQEYIVEAFDRD